MRLLKKKKYLCNALILHCLCVSTVQQVNVWTCILQLGDRWRNTHKHCHPILLYIPPKITLKLCLDPPLFHSLPLFWLRPSLPPQPPHPPIFTLHRPLGHLGGHIASVPPQYLTRMTWPALAGCIKEGTCCLCSHCPKSPHCPRH